METPAAEFAVKACLKELRMRLDEAARVARAAEVCADIGNIDKAVEIVLDLEQPVYEAGKLLDTASLINRIKA